MADNETNGIDFYGAAWCGDCHRAKAVFDRYDVGFAYHDIENEEGADQKAIEISGQKHIPVIRFSDGSFLVEPTGKQLVEKFASLGLVDEDSVIITE